MPLRNLVQTLSGAAVAAVLMFSAAGADAQDKSLTLVGPILPPYYYYDADKNIKGSLAELYDRIVTEAGYSWEGVLTPAARTMSSLADGVQDSSLLVKNPILDEAGTILTSEFPVAEMVLNVYAKDGLQDGAGLDQMMGKRVVVMRGYGYGGRRAWLDDKANGVTLTEADQVSQAVRLVDAGRVDMALLYDVNFSEAEKELGKQDGIASINLARVPLFLHLNKTTVENADAVMSDLLAAYSNLVQSGELAAPDSVPDDVLTNAGS